MISPDSDRNRLFRHDGRIAINTIRAAFAGWNDRLVAVAVLIVTLAMIKSWLAERPWTIAAWSAVGAGLLLGTSAERLVAKRLAFHGFDGLLAVDALRPATRRRYIAAWHGIALALLATVLLVVAPSLLIVGCASYLAGTLLAALMSGVTVPKRLADRVGSARVIRAWLRHGQAGALVASTLLVVLLLERSLAPNALIAILGIETTPLTLALTSVDSDVVRFMATTGYGPWRIVGYHGKSMAYFLALAVPGCWLIAGSVAAAAVTAVSGAVLLLLALRVLAYCLHGKRFADLIVSIFAGLLLFLAYFLPIALPFLAVAILWQLQHRARTKTWLLV